jgi:hypothetical protein
MSLQPKDDVLEISLTMNAFYLKDTDNKVSGSQITATNALNSPVMKEVGLLAGQNVNFNIIKSNIDKINMMSYNPVYVGPQGSIIRPNPFISKQ